MTEKLRSIQDIKRGASDPDGGAVAFTAVFDDGTEGRFAMLSTTLNMLIHTLVMLGEFAENQRQQVPAEHRRRQLSTGFQMQDFDVGCRSGGLVVMGVDTKQGVPVVVEMTPTVAADLATKLQECVLRAQRGPSGPVQ